MNELGFKLCTKCDQIKSIDEFGKHSHHRDGMQSCCKICKRLSDTRYRAANPDKNKEDYRKRIATNPNYWADRYASNSDAERRRVAAWRIANVEKSQQMHRQWRAKNPDYYREWPKRDLEKTKERRRKYHLKKLATPKGRIENAIRVGVHKGLTKGIKAGRRTFDLLGYGLNDLMERLESEFLPGMTWGNYGKWHIDHQIPLSAHHYETPDDIDFKKAWALSNLQPMWAADNIRKHAKLAAPFQPSLAIAD
jgi:hypothetical protein